MDIHKNNENGHGNTIHNKNTMIIDIHNNENGHGNAIHNTNTMIINIPTIPMGQWL